MYYSLFDVRTGVRNKTDEYQTQRVKDPELDIYINDARDHVCSLLFPLNEGYFVKTSTSNLVSGTSSYQLPDDCKALIDVDISTDNGQNYYIGREANIENRNARYDSSFTGSPYTYYFKGNTIELLSSSHVSSTNGVKFVYERELPLLDAGDEFKGDITYCTRTSSVIAVTAVNANYISDGDLFTLYGMDDDSFDGTFRYDSRLYTSLTEWVTGTAYTAGQHLRVDSTIYAVVNNHTSSALISTDVAAGDIVDVTSTTLTCRQEGLPDDSAANTAGDLYRRTGIDLPGGRTAKRLVEAWAARAILIRDEKDISAVDLEIKFLAGRLKKNTNPRVRARNKKVRLVRRRR